MISYYKNCYVNIKELSNQNSIYKIGKQMFIRYVIMFHALLQTGLEKDLSLDTTSELRSDAPTPLRISESMEVTGQETTDSHDVGNDIDCGTSSSINDASRLKQDIAGSSEAGATQKKVTKTFETFSQAEQTSPGDPNLDSDSGGDSIGPNSNKTDDKFYRMVLITGLAILLVLISNLEVFKETRYEAVRDTSFLPYFITLEIINLCLFPLDSDIEDSSVTLIILKAAGLADQTINTLIMVLRFSSRTLQDFALFVFTIVLANCAVSE